MNTSPSTPNDAELMDLVERLIQGYRPSKVILFGSRASGRPDQAGDIDLLIVKETEERFIDRWKTVRRILTDPRRKTPLDTLIMTPLELDHRLAVGDRFIQEIMETGIELYAA